MLPTNGRNNCWDAGRGFSRYVQRRGDGVRVTDWVNVAKRDSDAKDAEESG